MKFSHEVTFQIGDQVYRKTDEEQAPVFISGIIFRPGNAVVYLVKCYGDESEYYDFELSRDKVAS